MSDVRVVFRTKASPTVGFGHVRRCLTLAKTLRSQQVEVRFIVNSNEQLSQILKANHFSYATVDEVDQTHLQQTLAYLQEWQASVIIIDSYDIPSEAYAKLKDLPIVVIEDRVKVALPADLVINGSMNNNPQQATMTKPRLLLGVNYILLDEVFLQKCERSFPQAIKRVLITVGGGDQTELSLQLITWVRETLSSDVIIDVVIGPFFHDLLQNKLIKMADQDKMLILHHAPPTLFELMKRCDIALTGGGQTTFELAVMGVPSIAIRLIDNQTVNLDYLQAQGTLLWPGDIADKDLEKKVKQALQVLADHSDERKKMSERGRLVVDGLGAKRVAEEIITMCRRS